MRTEVMKKLAVATAFLALVCCVAAFAGANGPGKLRDKTLVVWVAPATLDQRGGSALTLDMANPDAFDAIVFAELAPNTWMAGSSGYVRTEKDQSAWIKESEANGEFVRVCVVYRGKTVEIYRGDELSARYEIDAPQTFDESATVLVGPRHVQDQRDVFIGKIKDARVYSEALTAEQIAALEPGQPLDGVEPWLWLDFGSTGLFDRAGRFNCATCEGDVAIKDGALVLGENKGKVVLTRSNEEGNRAPIPKEWSKSGAVPSEAVASARLLREKFLEDPYRPRWHFTVPDGDGTPGDPNGCFYENGRYHLMYLYSRPGAGFCWGHMTSVDLVHWRNEPDSIAPDSRDTGGC
ncbi:MAG: LamG-like jellyroll fold domain-containing protein, partial [Thermoguttaceae bacterium]